MRCFKCGVPDNRALLYDVISLKGVQKVCRKCLAEESDMPIVKKPKTFQLKETENKSSVYERLSKVAGIDTKKHNPVVSRELEKQEKELKEIADRNYEKAVELNPIPSDKFVDNFHWIIMRARRLKKLTQEQLAKELNESEAAIKITEKGIVPENKIELIRKIESFLKIRVFKEGERPLETFIVEKQITPTETGVEIISQEEVKKDISLDMEDPDFKFDPMKIQQVKISDLKKMREKKENEYIGPSNNENFPQEEKKLDPFS
jgi:ribosome-binding protein aMBF1 (putative translation factor)